MEQTLLIQGRELWRNPAVFVGSTRADTVDLLPDMRGVLAHFKSIPTTYGDSANLTVVTSFGADTLEGSIKIISASKLATNQPTATATLTNFFAVNGGQPLGFALAQMPSAFAGFSIKLSTKDTPGKWTNIVDGGYILSSNSTTLTIPIKITDTPTPTAPVVYTVDLGLRSTPSIEPATLLGRTNQAAPAFVYFPITGQEKPLVNNPIITYTKDVPDQSAINLGLVANVTVGQFYQAYPGLQKSVSDGSAFLSLSVKATKKMAKPLFLTQATGGWTVSTTVSASDLPTDTYDTLKIQYTTADGNDASIEVSGGPIIIKRR